MSEDALTAWRCIAGDANDELMSDAASIARSWIKSPVESWAEEVDMAKKRGGVRDTNNNIAPLLTYSRMHIEDFADGSFRIKGASFQPSKPCGSEEQPQPRVTLAIFSSIICEMGECAAVDSDEHVAGRNRRLEVCKT